ncbi:MAG: homocysteine S-methyltransferase family protein [Planctomycetes bacterium]|nr:homocysteine S-methyltransferase family protein [Planctomycetota bacterium]
MSLKPPASSPKPLLLDGATGTELGRRGVDISLPLWSARALLEAPDVLHAIHHDFLAAGADAITANTFRTHRRSLAKAGMGHRAAELTRLAVEIAKAARDEQKPDAIVLGSVAPLEDCYQPALAPDEPTCRAEHAEMIGNLVDAGVDVILIETMNNLPEARAAAREAQRLAPSKWIISFCTKSLGPAGILLSGEPIADLLGGLHDAYAVGVNCVAAPSVEAQVRLLRESMPDHVRILAYANIGYADEAGNWMVTDAVDPAQYAKYAQRWIDAGATIVGGCCGTTPGTIQAIADQLIRAR